MKENLMNTGKKIWINTDGNSVNLNFYVNLVIGAGAPSDRFVPPRRWNWGDRGAKIGTCPYFLNRCNRDLINVIIGESQKGGEGR
jgi:hypothetical protein